MKFAALALSGNLSMEYAPSVGREGGEVPNFTARFLRLIEQARPDRPRYRLAARTQNWLLELPTMHFRVLRRPRSDAEPA